MPIIQQQKHSGAKYLMLTIAQPAYGGLNIEDLDFTLPLNQSPDLQNVMYKNGIFGKRYGQTDVKNIGSKIYNLQFYSGRLFMQCEDGNIYSWDGSSKDKVSVFSGLKQKGFFFVFTRELYFLNKEHYLKFNKTDNKFSEVQPYAPDVLINLKPDGTNGNIIDDYNMLGGWLKNTFNADGTATVYQLSETKLGSGAVTILYTDSTASYEYKEGDGNFTVDRTTGKITFKTAPAKGNLNVRVTFEQAEDDYKKPREELLGCTMAIAFGGSNNSHLFLAGNGTSKYYYSDTVSADFFPETNYSLVGNAEDDITGFGIQYSVLIIFKPTEIFQLSYSYEMDSATQKYEVTFTSKPVNVQIGCDMPDTIQYIDNRLTWGNTDWGICTLCSTSILDERNVRVISRNINGGERKGGLLSEANLEKAFSTDFNGKYIVSINGHAWVWDYQNGPYTDSSNYTTEVLAKSTAWLYWTSIGYQNSEITGFSIIDHVLYYASGSHICKFDYSLNDFGKAIEAFYQTPMLDFQAYESLKTVKKAFFEVRGDALSNTAITYLTDENAVGEVDPEPIVINGSIWHNFSWNSFQWGFYKFSKTYARKCSLKKIALFGCKISNDDIDRDMDVASMKFEYTVVKEIK